MDFNFTFTAMTSIGEFSRGAASNLLIQQMIDLNMCKEKRINHNRFEMERYSCRAAHSTNGDRRVRNMLKKLVQRNTGIIRPVLRAIRIKD